MHFKLFIASIPLFLIVLVTSDTNYLDTNLPSIEDPYALNFLNLAKIRTERREQVENYLNNLNQLASDIVSDEVMLSVFHQMHMQDTAISNGLDMRIDLQFVQFYDVFYDLLFVSNEGFVFHSIRRESDYLQNLFDEPLASTRLSQTLKKGQEPVFVDFEQYGPSKESGAFFTVPVFDSKKNDEHLGWFVLQCSVNKLNSILTSKQNLGRTGETYLVSKSRKMISKSRFKPRLDGLELNVETRAVKDVFVQGKGEQVIKDYRGVHVLSSYESFEVHGTKWALVAEIDENEIITEHYKRYKTFYLDKMIKLAEHKTPLVHTLLLQDSVQKVDMNEFSRSPKKILSTKGISTCTAVTISLPGKFGYLAHVSPSDIVYGHTNHGYNNQVSELLHQVSHFDVYPYEISKLEVSIAATHSNSLEGIVDSLLEMGADLSQIKFALNPNAQLANVALFPDKGKVRVDWVNGNRNIGTTYDSGLKNLASFVKELATSS